MASLLLVVLLGALPLACTDPADLRTNPSTVESEDSIFNHGAGILNPAFDYWLDQNPLHWEITGGREQYVHRGKDDGVVETVPGFNYLQVTQQVDADVALAGTTVQFSCLARSQEKETVKLIIHLDDGTKVHSNRHEGDGAWQRLVVIAVIPEDYASRSLRVSLHHFGNPSRSAQFREPLIAIE